MSIEEELQDPGIPPARLAEISAARPDLSPAILAHPNCYPELRNWLTKKSQQLPPQNQPQPLSGTQTMSLPKTQLGDQLPSETQTHLLLRPLPPVDPQPQTSTPEQTVSEQKSAPPKRNRVPLFTAVFACIALVASVGVNIWQYMTSDSEEITAVSEEAFESPKEAFDYFTNEWSKGNFLDASAACVGSDAGENADLNAQIERLGAWGQSSTIWSDEPGFWQEHAAWNARRKCTSTLSSATATMLASNFDITETTKLEDGKILQDQWEFEPMESLEVTRFDLLDWNPESKVAKSGESVYAPFGGLEIAHATALIEVNGTSWGFGPSFVRYDDGWRIINPVRGTAGARMGIKKAIPLQMTKADYEEKLAKVIDAGK